MEIQENLVKAKEIQANDVCCVWNNGCPNVRNGAMKMAQWKDEQLKEILKKKMNFFYPPIDDYNEGKLAVLKDLYQELFNEYYI